MDEKVSITLNVTFPPTYPKTFPILQLNFDEDVGSATRKQALDVAQTGLKKLEPGTEMIYDIATLLQEVLNDASRKAARDVPTLDEERVAREAAMQKAHAEESERHLEAIHAKEAGNTEEEQRIFREMAEQEKDRFTQRKLTKISSAETPDVIKDIAGLIRFDQPSVMKNYVGQTIEVTSVFDKVLYRKGPSATIFTVQVWSHSRESKRAEDVFVGDAPFLVLKEYFVASSEADDSVKRAIQNLETNLDLQTRNQIPHPNVIKPINYLILRSDSRDEGSLPTSWSVSVLTELASKGSLLELLDMVGRVSDPSKIRAWALNILEGLHHYHRQGLSHGNIHLGNILLEQGEARNIVAKISDGGYGPALDTLKRPSIQKFTIPWRVPEHARNQTSTSVAGDIWDFGICLLQIGFGRDITLHYRAPMAVLDDLNLSESFRALLCQVFHTNPRKRPSAWDVLHFEFFRNDDALLEYQPRGFSGVQHPITGEPSLASHHARRESTTASAASRYAKEFVEDGRLGRGGFGEVFRARHKIDNQLYAIKKIKARSRAALDPVLSEASVLSRLNHPNVVRYFASWIDDAFMIESDTETEASAGNLSSSLSQYAQGPILPPSSRVCVPGLQCNGRCGRNIADSMYALGS